MLSSPGLIIQFTSQSMNVKIELPQAEWKHFEVINISNISDSERAEE